MFSFLTRQSTVSIMSSCSRYRAAVSLVWDLLCPQRLLCHPKTGRKLPLGQKHSEIGFTVSQTGDFQKEEFQDLVNLAQYTGCPMSKISSFCNAFSLPWALPLPVNQSPSTSLLTSAPFLCIIVKFSTHINHPWILMGRCLGSTLNRFTS